MRVRTKPIFGGIQMKLAKKEEILKAFKDDILLGGEIKSKLKLKQEKLKGLILKGVIPFVVINNLGRPIVVVSLRKTIRNLEKLKSLEGEARKDFLEECKFKQVCGDSELFRLVNEYEKLGKEIKEISDKALKEDDMTEELMRKVVKLGEERERLGRRIERLETLLLGRFLTEGLPKKEKEEEWNYEVVDYTSGEKKIVARWNRR